MGTHNRVLSNSFPMNTNMTGFRYFHKYLRPSALEESSLSIGRVKGLTTGLLEHYFTYASDLSSAMCRHASANMSDVRIKFLGMFLTLVT